jgi:hypothetical protein
VLTAQFRQDIDCQGDKVVDREGQQQVLRPTFEGIRDSVRELVEKKMDALGRRFTATHNTKLKVEFDRLDTELVKLNKPWRFGVK